MGILNGERSLPDPAHSLHGCATHGLGHGSGVLVHQDGVELVQLLSPACKARDARGHADEGSRRRLKRLRTPFDSGKDTAPTLHSTKPSASGQNRKGSK